MVVFTCNNCGDSLQKPKVEKHYTFACRVNKSLTCVDCLKDFRGEEYQSHTKCLTEDERYAAKGTYVNGIVKKGEVKQETWVEMIKYILDTENNLKPSSRNLLNTISHHSNIPRKKPKFINFIKSSYGGRANMKDVEDVWNIIEKYKNEKAKSGQNTSGNNEKADESQNGDSSISEEKNSKNKENESKKRKTVEAEDTPKKKKHKKNQEIEDTIVENENVNVENVKDDQKKKKKHKRDAEETVDINGEALDENAKFNFQENVKDDQKKKKKNKRDAEETVDINGEALDKNAKFNFQEKIVEIVMAKGSVSLKKLEKKVLKAYINQTNISEITPKAVQKFHKNLRKIPNLEVIENKVTILEKNTE